MDKGSLLFFSLRSCAAAPPVSLPPALPWRRRHPSLHRPSLRRLRRCAAPPLHRRRAKARKKEMAELLAAASSIRERASAAKDKNRDAMDFCNWPAAAAPHRHDELAGVEKEVEKHGEIPKTPRPASEKIDPCSESRDRHGSEGSSSLELRRTDGSRRRRHDLTLRRSDAHLAPRPSYLRSARGR
jgi:hypothetical protein